MRSRLGLQNQTGQAEGSRELHTATLWCPSPPFSLLSAIGMAWYIAWYSSVLKLQLTWESSEAFQCVVSKQHTQGGLHPSR